MSRYAAVVVGAGNAGLTAAVTLQRAGLDTLLVERHRVPGGCATSFRRGRFEFETALHQLSGVGRPDQPFSIREMFRRLDVLDSLEFVEEQSVYRAAVPGVLDVVIPADWSRALDVLDAHFPGNRVAVERFFDLVRTVTFWQMAALKGARASRIDRAYFDYALRPLDSVLDELITDDRLRYTLGAYWLYIGQPPSVVAFQDFALMLYAYMEYKPWHVRGGSQAMSTALLSSFIRAGGTAVFSTSVEHIRTRGGAVCGVELSDGDRIETDLVFSNASLPVTYDMLDVPAPERVRRDLATRRIGVSAFMLHMGLAATPDELGFVSSSSFLSVDTHENSVPESWRRLDRARNVMVTNYDVEPIGFSPPDASHLSVLTLQYASAWDRVSPADYVRTKYRYAETLLDLVEAVTPGVRDVIEEVEVATPLTVMRYLGHPGGAIYGYDQDPSESWVFRDSDRESHVPGLHLCGSWAGLGGFQPTLEAGERIAQTAVARRRLAAA